MVCYGNKWIDGIEGWTGSGFKVQGSGLRVEVAASPPFFRRWYSRIAAFPSRGRCPKGADRVTMAWKTAGIRFPGHSYESCKSPAADGTRKWDDRYFTSSFWSGLGECWSDLAMMGSVFPWLVGMLSFDHVWKFRLNEKLEMVVRCIRI